MDTEGQETKEGGKVKTQKPKKLPPGNAVQVISLPDSGRDDEETRELRLNTQVLRDIVSKAGDYPIAVITIAGPGRKGKSFMLSYIVRYLQALERSENGDAGDWMDKKNPNVPWNGGKGFTFRNGMDRTTDGIWMWTRPFIIKKSGSDSPIAVLVMDTEGCFDPYSNDQEQSSIVGLSLLLSSCFIYNDSGLINENTIATLAKFMQYGQIASECFDGKVFQRLMFLIRDWTTTGFEYGAAGGQGFILKCLSSTPRMSQQAKDNRKLIHDNFEDYNAYLMPFPGREVVSDDFTGSVGEMNKEFQNHVELFVSNLIADVYPKKFANELALQNTFLKLFMDFVKAFNSSDMPSPNSILSSMIYSTYDSRIRTLSQTYVQEFEKKLSAKDVPFLPFTKLEKFHKQLKLSAQEGLTNQKRLGSPEDLKLFQDKLAESIDLKFKFIFEENSEKQKDFISSLQEKAIGVFKNFIDQLIMTSDKLWTESEFQLELVKAEEDALAQFRTSTKSFPNDLINAQLVNFKTKLQASKQHCLELMTERRVAAQKKISSILGTFVTNYKTWMDVMVTDEDILSQKKLQQAHDNLLNKLSAEFSTAAGKEFNDENFINEFQVELQSNLQAQFRQVRQANQERINAVITLIKTDISEAEEVFKEESEEILMNASSSSVDSLKELYETILSMGFKTIEDRGLPDAQQVSAFKENLVASLKQAFNLAQGKISDALALKTQKCDNCLQNKIDSFSQSIQELLERDDIVQSLDLETHIESKAQFFRTSLESTISNIGSDPSFYLNSFDQHVAVKRKQLVDSNSKKVRAFERQVNDRLQVLKDTYKKEMKLLEQKWMCHEHVATSHQNLSSELFLRFINEPPLDSYTNQIEKYEPIFREGILHLYDPFCRQLETKVEKFNQIQTQTIPSWVSHYNVDMLDYIHQNPLISAEHITHKIDQDSKELRSRLSIHITQGLQDSALGKAALKNFDKEMALIITKLQQDAITTMQRANKSIEELSELCVNFADNHEAFKSMQTNFTSSSSAHQETIKLDTRAYFDTHWNIPSTAEEKEKNWEKILRIISAKFQSVFEQLLSKSNEEKDVLRIISGSIMSTFCSDIVNFLGNTSTKFYPAETLEELLNQARTKAISEFQILLEDKGINPSNKLEEIESELESKMQLLREQNLVCINMIVVEAEEISRNHYEASRKSIKTQAHLDQVQVQANEQSWAYIRESCFDQVLENHPVIVETFKDHSEKIYKDFLQALEAETAQPEVRDKLIENAIKMYQDTMNKRLEGYEAVNPENLLDFHTFSVRAAQRKVGQTHFLKKEIEEIIDDRLKLSYQIFEEKNNIAHAQRNNIAVGIDLGTTTSCVAIYQSGQAHVIKDNSGRSLTPSCVFFDEKGSTIVGNEAKNQASYYPESTIFDSKRLIGREFNDPVIQDDIKLWPFEVAADEKGKPKIVVRGMEFSPEGISAKVLMHMRRLASKQLNKKVSKAVITVPANFSDRQRDATRQAALIAGLEVLQIINEPTAAAMAYALNWKDEEKTVLVFDFGGGTFDVSILRTEGPPEPQSDVENLTATGVALPPAELPDSSKSGSRLRVLGTNGDTHLGGEDFDSRMVEFCVQEFYKTHKIQLLENGSVGNKNTTLINRRLRRLRTACEEAKANLTATTNVQIHLDEVCEGQDLNITMTRAQFEKMNEDLFQRAIDIVKKALREARVRKQEITEVLMVGGSSRIPRVRKLLQEFLGISSLNINQTVDIQEAVAMGAAVQACILNGGSTVGNLPLIKDIQPFSLGIATATGKMAVIISRNTYIPCTAHESFRTVHENQNQVKIGIYAGEDFQATKNVPLGSFTLKGIPPGLAGSQTIEVRMEIDLSGILNVTATAISTGRSQNLIIEECRGRYTDEEISEMRNGLVGAVQ